MQDNPILVEVTRGGLVESCHRGAVAIADADGRVLLGLGDIERPVYPRSAVKALQAIPLIESGAADAFGLRQAELAIACASHSGDETHIGAVRTLLVPILDRYPAGERTHLVEQLQLRQPQQVTWKVHALGGTLLRDFVVLAQECRQPQCFQMMIEQDLRRPEAFPPRG